MISATRLPRDGSSYAYIRSNRVHVRREACVTGGSSQNEIKLIFASGRQGISGTAHSSSLSVLMELGQRHGSDRGLVYFFSAERGQLGGPAKLVFHNTINCNKRLMAACGKSVAPENLLRSIARELFVSRCKTYLTVH